MHLRVPHRRESGTLVHREVSAHFLLVGRDLGVEDLLLGFVTEGGKEETLALRQARSEEVVEHFHSAFRT